MRESRANTGRTLSRKVRTSEESVALPLPWERTGSSSHAHGSMIWQLLHRSLRWDLITATAEGTHGWRGRGAFDSGVRLRDSTLGFETGSEHARESLRVVPGSAAADGEGCRPRGPVLWPPMSARRSAESGPHFAQRKSTTSSGVSRETTAVRNSTTLVFSPRLMSL